MGEHHREDRYDPGDRDYRVGRTRASRSQTVRSRSRRSRSQTVRSRSTTRSRYYQLPANLTTSDEPPTTGSLATSRAASRAASRATSRTASKAASRARHRLARARHSLARAGYRVVRPRGGSSRLPTPIEALLPWGPVLVGIGILIGLMISVFVVPASNVTPGLPDLAIPPGNPDPTPSPPQQNADQGPRYLVPEAYEVQYSPTPPPPAPPPPPPEAELIAQYKLEEVFQDVFIAAVTITNESSVAGDWTVELDYGPDVGGLNTFWVDGTSQPSLQRDDDRFIFTSAEDVPAQSAVALKVHFDRFGFDIFPKVCLVNGEECAILDDYGDGPGW